MPSLVLTGHPCTGKTKFAALLSQRAKKHSSGLIKNTVIINEQSARPDKTLLECYATSTEEKLTRSALKSEFDKHVIGDTKTLVILDSLNYIKGFRYELHCISKAVGEKHGVIWLLCREEVAKKWNEKRSDERQKYSEEIMNELILRYEPPDQRNRWDKPLYRVDVHSTLEDKLLEELQICKDNENTNNDDTDDDQTGRAAENILNKSVYNMHSLSDAIKGSTQSATVTSKKKIGSSFRRASPGGGFKRAVATDTNITHSDTKESVIAEGASISNDEGCEQRKHQAPKRKLKKMEDLVDAILDSFLLDVEPLKEGQSTKLSTAASSNVLHDVDIISQNIATTFLNAQRNTSLGNGGSISVPIGSGKTFSIQINKTVQIVEMKRLRKQYVRWVKDNPPRDTSSMGISYSFLSFLENQL